MKIRRRRLECEAWRTEHAVGRSCRHVMSHAHPHAMMAKHKHAASPTTEQANTSPVTGGGLVNVPPAPGSGDVGMLQNAASGNQLIIFLTQFEALSGSNSTTQQMATSILNDARNVELALDDFAASDGVSLPGNISASGDQNLAQQMIYGIKKGQADQTFSNLIVQAESSLHAVPAGSQAPRTHPFAPSPPGSCRPSRMTSRAPQGTTTLAPVSNVASSATLSTSDLNTLETYYSIDLMEHFLGQLTMLVTTKNQDLAYSAKLIGDHEGANAELGTYAASTQTYLPASISSSDSMMAMSVIAGLKTTGPRNSYDYDQNYLTQMIMGHKAALQLTNSLIPTEQNPVLKQFEVNVKPTVWMHLQTARTLYRKFVQ